MVLFCRKEYFMKQELLAKMNAYLANQEIMYIKLHNMHWNLKGHGFFTLHSKLEEYYDQTAEIIDEVAERILAKDALPIANLRNFRTKPSTLTRLFAYLLLMLNTG